MAQYADDRGNLYDDSEPCYVIMSDEFVFYRRAHMLTNKAKIEENIAEVFGENPPENIIGVASDAWYEVNSFAIPDYTPPDPDPDPDPVPEYPQGPFVTADGFTYTLTGPDGIFDNLTEASYTQEEFCSLTEGDGVTDADKVEVSNKLLEIGEPTGLSCVTDAGNLRKAYQNATLTA